MSTNDSRGAIDRLPEYLKTHRTAEALTSPSAILVAGAGTSVAILAGVPLLAAAGLGAVAWAARVAIALPRRPKHERIDPSSLAQPWQGFVHDAIDAAARYQRAMRATLAGPLRERLGEIGARIDAGVHECFRIAKQGDVLQHALADLDVASAQHELASLEASSDGNEGNRKATIESLQAQIGSSRRLAEVAADAGDRLRLLNARLDEAVARAVELSLRVSDVSELGGLGSDIDALVSEMESLRLGLEEAGRVSAPGTA